MHKQYQAMDLNKAPKFLDEEEEAQKQKLKKQDLARKRFAKNRFYEQREQRQKQGDSDLIYDADKETKKTFTKLEKYELFKKEYSKYNLQQLCQNEGIQFDNQDLNIKWLPLYYYDDTTMETIFVDEKINFNEVFTDEQGQQIEAYGQALYRQNEEQEYIWVNVRILSYDENIQRLQCQILNEDNEVVEEKNIPRIFVCFQIEDPRKYARRLACAFQRRLHADSLIRYKFYVSAMPPEHLSELSSESRENLDLLVKIRKLENSETTALMMEIAQEYAYTMNGIIFNKYLEESAEDIVPHSLVLPPKEEVEPVKEYGLLPLNNGPLVYMFSEHDIYKVPAPEFTDVFKEFCSSSFLTTPESIGAIQQIKEECNQILDFEFFKIEVPQQPYKIEDFQTEQEQFYHSTVNRLKTNWVPAIEQIIRGQFKNANKGWQDLDEKSMVSYEQGKLKKFFTLVNTLMQDSLLFLCQKSFKNYLDFVSSFIPKEVIVEGPNRVINVFKNGHTIKSFEEDTFYSVKAIKPLFQLQLLKNTGTDEEEEGFFYSKVPEAIVLTIQQIFDKLIEDINKIPNTEKQILHDLFRKHQQLQNSYLKAPFRDIQSTEATFDANKGKWIWNENEWVNQLYKELTTEITNSVKPLEDFLRQFDDYKPILKKNPVEYAKQYEQSEAEKESENAKEINIAEIAKDIKSHAQQQKLLLEKMPTSIQVSIFQIECKETVDFLSQKFESTQSELKDLISKTAKSKTIELLKKMKKIKEQIQQKPENIEKLTATLEYMEQIPQDLDKIKKEINESMSIYKVLDELKYKLEEDDIKKKWDAFKDPKDIIKIIQDQKAVLEKEKIRFRDQMDTEQESFKAELKDVQTTIMNFSSYTNISQHLTVSGIAQDVNNKLKEFQEKAKKYNVQEDLFGREMTDYSSIQQMVKDFQPYSNLWVTGNQWFKNIDQWDNGKWESLDAQACEKFVEEAFKTFNSVIRFFRDKAIDPVLKIAQSIKSQIDTFRPKVPLMVALRKDGMYERHWEQISEQVGFTVQPTEDFTFTKLLDLGLMKHLEVCVEVGERASKEYHIEKQLKSMKEEWDNIDFETLPYKNGMTFIIKNYDDLNNILDEHIVQTQSMQFSPFKKPFEEEILEWNNTLKLMSDILEEWTKYQLNWMYLQPIFDSPDIAKQLPGESKKFKQVDNGWKTTMSMTKQIMNVVKVCTVEGLLQKLKDGNENLDMIQKALNDYLERKREAFARFYFLSNDDLLEILSETKDPTKVQPHLRKVFESIDKLEFNEEKKILAMFSEEQEKIMYDQPIDPVNKNVEDWMTEVEKMMKCSIRTKLHASVVDYSTKKRVDWVGCHPGMCILNGSQIVWTKEVEQAISEGKVKDYFLVLEQQLRDLVELVRTKLPKNTKRTVNAIITLDVHAKDVVETLYKNDISNIAAFEWISQLRFYWETSPETYDEKVDNSHMDDCWVRCVQTHFPYGYEYLGNSGRLVITPLTDKCYMTLMGAVKLNLGGAPAGPAGTGKTETTKDLAKALAKQCVVFNCSDQMDYIMVGKFFKGLASAGAWCCFDEFNRINIEVLSVIAQQLRKLFDEKIKGSTVVENFEGSTIKLKKTFNVYITMNPGYAGRTELPDNLKALFRGVAMMVPDYAMIGEIMLYSFGFSAGRALAIKMVVTFKLASEQLSSQDHYDYGMRAVRSVINAAGLLKAAHPNEVEDKLLLRALRDVNVPKFLKDDIPLFENIILDIFPNISRPEQNYGPLLESLNESCEKFNLQPEQSFIDKVIQLYDTIQVRHGLMLVGPTGGGKTKNYCVLQDAISRLNGQEDFYKVHTHILNPKSITMGQLYGCFSEATREWQDGVVAYIIRESCRDRTQDRHWVLFDGPVDAIWIESMNTVLDDNKKLCLNSGQILALTNYMVIMFEVEDLAVASPATVSRCGMVYMEPTSLGIQPLITSWINAIPENFRIHSKTFSKTLQDLFDKYLQPALEFVRKHIKEVVVTMDNNLTQSLCRILDCTLVNYIDTELKKVTVEEIQDVERQIESLFLYALIWSVGCTGDYNGREQFNNYLIEVLTESKPKDPLPLEDNEGATIYDFEWNQEEKLWVKWSERYKNFEVDDKLIYSEVMIPTNDSTRNNYNMKLLLGNKYHCLFPGPTGTGKSLNSYDLLSNHMGETYQYIAISFSAQTGANQTQDTIDSKIDKRRRGIYGPPVGKRCIIFVDDLNMPKKEEYGAQPPLELIRQFMDHQGWYERKTLQFMKLEDIVFLSAMGPPGGGRAAITARLKRHYNIIAYTELDQQTISNIFITLGNSFLSRFPEEIKGMINELVSNTLVVYNTCKQELLPTPKKSHYTFNLRDMSKVFMGICNVSSKYTTEAVTMVRLWYHENMRVFHDRLIDEPDREFLKDLLCKKFGQFGYQKEDVLDQERILFTDFWHGKDQEPRQYVQVPDIKALQQKMNDFQEEFNSDPSFAGATGKNAMKLVLFVDACEHICRITRILRQPQGNALLLGVGGSGRQSLTKMATFVSNYNLFQIQVIKGYNMKSWREDIKTVLMQAGISCNPVTFLFVDTQIINEQQVEDLNSILNSGDVTNIYQDADMEEIVNACKGDCIKKNLQPNKMNIYSQYLLRVKNNIHLTIAMSPLSSVFQVRLRMFPSLVNNCTLDWFTEWPEEALVGVGKGQLADFSNEMDISNDQLSGYVEVFKVIHKSVEKSSVKYLDELNRTNHVTPTSYLELLTMFKQIMKEKTTQLNNAILRLKTGLDRLISANEQVSAMEIQLTEDQPKLAIKQKETQELLVKIESDKKDAEVTKKIVAEEEALAAKQTAEAEKIKNKAEASVKEANEKLDIAVAEVKKLKKNHIDEVRSLKTPPAAAKIILGGMCYLLQDQLASKGQRGIIMENVQGAIGKKEENYFKTAGILLQNSQELLDTLLQYDKENINPKFIQQIKDKVLNGPDKENFNLEKASSCSLAIKYIFLWIQAMYDFYEVFTTTQPIRDELAAVQKELDAKMIVLNEKRKQVADINAKLAELQAQLDKSKQESADLEDNINECKVKLERAIKLTGGLGDEKVRWAQEIEHMKEQSYLIAGNSIVGAGMVAYQGAFTSEYRQSLQSTWLEKIIELAIPHTKDVVMAKFLGDPVKIQHWNICGLPKDDTSIENGIIINKSRRWPLMIDPQTQANKYIKNLGSDKDTNEMGIQTIKMSDTLLMRTLENAIQFGQWVLVENVPQVLDPSLEPILLQQVVKAGSSLSITIGDKTLVYNESFKFFMTTTNPNPAYSPETFVKVCIINFAITPSGLEDQMLAVLVAKESPQLEQEKTNIVKRNAQDNRTLFEIEETILKSLQQTSDINELLKDETLINTLQNAKKTAAEINQRMKDSKITEQQIDETREGFRPVAFRASILFFSIVLLNRIDPMYEYSLQWFINLFINGIANANQSQEHAQRLKFLNEYFTYSLYENVCRSLFERHKLLFSFMLTISILQGDDQIVPLEWRYLLTGPTGEIQVPENPTDWLDVNQWGDIYKQVHGANEIESLKGFKDKFLAAPDVWKPLYDSQQPEEMLDQLPGEFNEKTDFQKMILLKCLRPGKLIPAIENFIIKYQGKEFIIPPTFDLQKCYKDSTALTPLIFVLSSGSDPVADFQRFAEEMDMSNRYESTSLGQGQGKKAEKIIKDNCNKGGWVLLQNCHLAQSWMPELERLVEEFNDQINPDFRLWLTSMPSNYFPISVLQNGVKMTLEPPQGLRSNLKRSYTILDDNYLNDCKQPEVHKKLLFGFCFFHAIIQDRRKFGPIGWNIPYEFTNEDLMVCQRQLKMLLDDFDEVPYKVLNFLGSEINYGGRVTDDKDVRLIKNILINYMNPKMLEDNHPISASGIYKSIPAGEHADYINYIESLPINPSPEAFGLHENAEITNAQNQTRILLETVLSVQPRSSATGGKTREEVIEEIASFIQSKTPNTFDQEAIFKKYPTDYNESMNTVLIQEIVRYNRLLAVMKVSLVNVKKALKGLVVMSEDLELMANQMFDNIVPKIFDDKGFVSLKPLASWVNDLNARIEFLQKWIDNGTPKTFWMSGFFFPQAFVTGCLQNYARLLTIPVDKLSFDYKILDNQTPEQITEKPKEGAIIYGLFIEGARWDSVNHTLASSKPKELFSDLPMIHLQPVADRVPKETGIYKIPLYRVVSRTGTLSTTGHSTNFVMYYELASDQEENHWIVAGVASFLSLRY